MSRNMLHLLRIFTLLFALLLLTMAFMANGPGSAEYVFNALLLLWIGVQLCSGLRALASMRSVDAIMSSYKSKFYDALNRGDLATADEVLTAQEMFIDRGKHERPDR